MTPDLGLLYCSVVEVELCLVTTRTLGAALPRHSELDQCNVIVLGWCNEVHSL